MKTTKYNQGSVALWIIILVIVVLIGGGVYYYFNKTQSYQNTSQQPVSSSNVGFNNQDVKNPATDNSIMPSSQQLSDACSYITTDDLVSTLGSSVHQFRVQPSNQTCIYMEGVGDAETSVAFLEITTTTAPSIEISGNYQQVLKIGGSPLQGIGDMAAERDITKSNPPTVAIYFFKKGTIGTLEIDVLKGQTVAEVSAQAQNLAKLVVNKI
jgi:hypothetical protein